MVANKSETSPIRLIQKNISLMKINNITLMLRTRIMLSSFVIYFFCICHSGSFPIIYTYSMSISTAVYEGPSDGFINLGLCQNSKFVFI